MTPFHQFRLWWRRAAVQQRAVTGVVGVAVLALLVWIAVPSGNRSQAVASGGFGTNSSAGNANAGGSSGSSAPTQGSAPAGQPSTAGSTPGAGGGTTAQSGGSSTGFSGSTAGGGTVSAPGGPSTTAAPGATGSGGGSSNPSGGSGSTVTCAKTSGTLPVGVAVISIGAGALNSLFGAPSTSAQEAEWTADAAAVNQAGGVGCHNVALDFQTFDETNPSSAHTACLAFIGHHDFAVLGGFLPSAPDDCLLQAHIPVFEEIPVSGAEVQRYAPYYFSVAGEYQIIYNNYAHASAQLGAFDPAKGFKKVGIFYRDCQPDVNAALISSLEQVGVTAAHISKFDLGCAAAFAAPSALQQAVLQFKAAGVTTGILDNDDEDVQNITKDAQQQGFRPKWVVPDYGESAITATPTFAPDPTNFDGALAITPYQYGGIQSALPESDGTKHCDAAMTGHGQPTVYNSPVQFAGAVCNLLALLQAAVANEGTSTLSQAGLATGLQNVGSVTMSFPNGPNNFKQNSAVGGEFWRPITYHSACGCWKVNTPTFAPSF